MFRFEKLAGYFFNSQTSNPINKHVSNLKWSNFGIFNLIGTFKMQSKVLIIVLKEFDFHFFYFNFKNCSKKKYKI